MLKSLFIRNVALIERAELEFSEGLNVLTGETGAGKSVILDCIDFVLGAKADRGMIRYGETECLVKAEFTSDSDEISALLSEYDIEAEDTILIARKLTSDGKSSLKVNGNTVTVAMLRRLTSLLVDVHGQSEHFFLLKESNQRKLLDALGGDKIDAPKTAVRELVNRRKELLSEKEKLGGDEAERARRLDILSYQIGELERADLSEEEEATLLTQRDKLRNAEKIVGGLSAAMDSLLSDGGVIDGLNGAVRALHSVEKFDATYAALAERLESVTAEAEDLGSEIEHEAGSLDVDEQEAERIEERLDLIKSLKKKYGGSIPAALAYLDAAREEKSLLESSAERCEALEKELGKVDASLFDACIKLKKARGEVAAALSERVVEELRDLNISSAAFRIEIGSFTPEDVPRANSEGLGEVRFLFSANAGEPLKELGKIISGGEMSRFMLAIKAQMSAVGEIGTYIFDEIDAGIGGKTARVVGEKFCKIAQKTQIIAVSHLAQIACFADKNFYIEKGERDGRTLTQIVALGEEEKRTEIARLIGGDVGEIALSHADELLRSARAYKNFLS